MIERRFALLGCSLKDVGDFFSPIDLRAALRNASKSKSSSSSASDSGLSVDTALSTVVSC